MPNANPGPGLWSAVDDCFTGLPVPPDPALDAALEASASAARSTRCRNSPPRAAVRST